MLLHVVTLSALLLAVAVTAVPAQPAATDAADAVADAVAAVLPDSAADDIAIIMDGFVDTGDDSRDGRLDNGAEAFAFDGVLDVGQVVERDGVMVAIDGFVADGRAASAIDQRSGAKVAMPETAEGVLDTSHLYGNIGVEGRPE